MSNRSKSLKKQQAQFNELRGLAERIAFAEEIGIWGTFAPKFNSPDELADLIGLPNEPLLKDYFFSLTHERAQELIDLLKVYFARGKRIDGMKARFAFGHEVVAGRDLAKRESAIKRTELSSAHQDDESECIQANEISLPQEKQLQELQEEMLHRMSKVFDLYELIDEEQADEISEAQSWKL